MPDKSPSLIVVGTGDHARVVLDIARALDVQPLGCVDPSDGHAGGAGGAGREIAGVPLLGEIPDLVSIRTADSPIAFTVAIGDNAMRRRAFERCVDLGLRPLHLVHPSAIVLSGASIGPGAQICAGAIVGVGAQVGANVIVNTGATVDHDTVVGDHAFLGPGTHLAGRARIGAECFIGIGAVVRQGIVIGDHCVVAAGAAVVDDVAPRSRVAGVPARPMRGSD